MNPTELPLWGQKMRISWCKALYKAPRPSRPWCSCCWVSVTMFTKIKYLPSSCSHGTDYDKNIERDSIWRDATMDEILSGYIGSWCDSHSASKTSRRAVASAASPCGVLVAWAFKYKTSLVLILPFVSALCMARIAPLPFTGGWAIWCASPDIPYPLTCLQSFMRYIS